MKSALEAMRNKEMNNYKASRIFNVPQTTLELYVKDREKSSNEAIKPKQGRKQVLSCEAENDLVQHWLSMERKFFWCGNSRRHASRLTTCCKKRN
jgi:uncharacterized HAD superfamily protein